MFSFPKLLLVAERVSHYFSSVVVVTLEQVHIALRSKYLVLTLMMLDFTDFSRIVRETNPKATHAYVWPGREGAGDSQCVHADEKRERSSD